MRIYTRIVMDWEGCILESDAYEYYGPIAKCDRSLVNQAENAGKTATQTAANYQAAAGGVQSNLVPRLENEAVNPAGYGAFGLDNMETEALSSAGAASGSAQEQARLRAMRTGNAANLNATTAAGAGEAARAGGGALQSILAKNAQLKATQQQQANQGLEGVLGEDIKGNIGAEGLVPEDINASANAQKVGWLNDLDQFGEFVKDLTPAGGK